MKFICALILLFLPVISLAEDAPLLQLEPGEFLPLANGRVTIPFVQPETAVPVQPGATVEFVTQNGLRVLALRWTKGYVLGSRGGIALIEVGPNAALNIAEVLETRELRLRT